MSFKDKKIVYIDFDEIQKNDMVWGLLALGVNLVRPKINIKMHDPSEEDILCAIQAVSGYEAVFTQDFSCTVAEACHRENITYVSWVYDSPQRALFTKEALYETNRIFMFDRAGVNRLKAFGVKNIYHFPLAANVTQASAVNITDEDMLHYGSDISFVGNLYRRAATLKIIENMPGDLKEDFMRVVNDSILNWHPSKIREQLPKKVEEYLAARIDASGFEEYKIDKSYTVETLFLNTYISSMEREKVLNICSSKYPTRLYTSETDTHGLKVCICPKVNYEDEMYKVFFSSKINLNITYRPIETGIPQRVFDIMSVGGFCLSNYQQEISEFFEEDRDIVMFYDEYDLKNKLDYYLSHERQRVTIGINGYKKVKEYYSYEIMLGRMFDMLDKMGV